MSNFRIAKKVTCIMAQEMPKNVQQKRSTMDEPSDRRDLDLTCHCGQTKYYLGIKWHKATFATVLSRDEDGEEIWGDRTAPAPYAYWMCANGHIETDGY